MSGLEVFGAVAAIPTIVKQLSQFINSTKETIQAIRKAVGKYEELAQDLVSISKVIDSAGEAIDRVVKEMVKNEAASTSEEINFVSLIQQMDRDIKTAQRKLETLEPGSSLKDRMNFVMRCRVEIEAVIGKVSQTGMFLNITLVNLLMQAILEESSSNSLKVSLINSGIQTSLNETLEAVKDAVKDVLNRPARSESPGPESSTENQRMDGPSKAGSIKSTISEKSWFKSRPKDSNQSLRQLALKVRNTFTSSTSKSNRSQKLAESDDPAISPEPECISAPGDTRTSVYPTNANDGSSDQEAQSRATENDVPLTDMDSLMQDNTADLGSPQAGLAVPDTQDQSSFDRDENVQACCLDDGNSRETDELGTSANFMASNTSGCINSPRLMDILRNNRSTGKISHAHEPTDAVKQSWLDNRSWVSAAIEKEMSYRVLVFQRPDNWIQLAILPRDHDEATVLETPLLQEMENTPLSCHFDYIDSNSRSLRIYFFTANEERLSICTVTFRPPFLVRWSVMSFPHETGDTLPPLPGMGFFCSTDDRTISYASASGSLVSLSETEAGKWIVQFFFEEYPVRHGDQVTQRVRVVTPERDEGPCLYLRIYRQGESTTHQFEGVDDWDHFFHHSDKVETSKKDIHWQGLTIDKTSIPYIPIDSRSGIIGFLCRTVENEVYLIEGHPWNNEQEEPTYICTVKPGSNFSFSRNFNDFFFISVEGNLTRIRVEVSESECISCSKPNRVFHSSGNSRQQLKDISYPGIIRV
ncbi:hypothetical protein FOCG_15074 [Fusarium oxysporum f. sp. radicis-lycopersici 26381]|nr:hypothetical protein FOCG_15074 [Fusarium oxysporum f. sp. radicis-lycopersici 26381]